MDERRGEEGRDSLIQSQNFKIINIVRNLEFAEKKNQMFYFFFKLNTSYESNPHKSLYENPSLHFVFSKTHLKPCFVNKFSQYISGLHFLLNISGQILPCSTSVFLHHYRIICVPLTPQH